MKIKVTEALQALLSSQIETHCAEAELGNDHNTLYLKLNEASAGKHISLTEDERAELWKVCDYIDECWEDYPQDRALARRWRARVETPSDKRN
jgi:hypothetical protein